MIVRRSLLSVALVVLSASSVLGDWKDDYKAGVKAAQSENWRLVIEKMTAAIAARPNENPRERDYGAVFIKYHPYYYRGVAHFNLKNYKQAAEDLKKAKGVGDVSLGALETMLDRAETRLADAGPPDNTTTTTTTIATTTNRDPDPLPPPVDPAVRSAAEQRIAAAQARRTEAQREEANTFVAADYNGANAKLSEALGEQANADSTADWRRVDALADTAARLFDVAIQNAKIVKDRRIIDPNKAAEAALAQTRKSVREALEAYFDGNFRQAESRLNALVTTEQKSNAMLWAFLGAARYYSWYLNGAENETERRSAETAFREAKRLRRSLVLDDDYFSPKVRSFYGKVQS